MGSFAVSVRRGDVVMLLRGRLIWRRARDPEHVINPLHQEILTVAVFANFFPTNAKLEEALVALPPTAFKSRVVRLAYRKRLNWS